ncbi:methyl-accepting chemotaxis protein [Desulfocurvibacter africanus]|uniref:Methyl-accepting chemotaxis sensory transducer with Cache sensor n=1 Tax=Desulfocurvibacter africanus subsp. africanus str. Walvis Bay TaxID=690850 RepID=F3YXU8_DESAF|nr:cache domain-containing protein [Desulfocurvibacter africanus]EGJ50650.1 methyl-accepting chemotaxis sensory transducer with Cache sensor [Desulfocurvibacter africanus subsp. africanus str. Walvis Bay]
MRLTDVNTSTKIMGISVLTLALTAGAVLFYLLPFFSDLLMEDRLNRSSNLVEVAWSLLGDYAEDVRMGRLSEDEAKRRAMVRLGGLRFGQDNYFWINDFDGVMLMHPLLPQLKGKSLLDDQDEQGKYYMREMLEAARTNGEGYVEYIWPKPGSLELAPKISYVKVFQPWNWLVGCGIYVDDVQREVAAMRNTVIIFGLIAMAGLLALAYFMAGMITGPIVQATDAAGQLAEGALPEVHSERRDESGRLLAAMSSMASAQREMAEKAEAISRGDLSVEVVPRSEQDVLGQALARMIESLRAQMGEISDGVGVLAASAAEIASLVNQLAANAAQTSVSVEETVTTVEELRQTSHMAASKADEVSNSARRNAEIAVSGQSATRDAVLGMEDIRAKMDSISQSAHELIDNTRTAQDIIDTVNDLADQSNLLAVNAAIEAARVEHGAEGFAVVAAEMRSLAEESKQGAARVRKLLAQMRVSSERTTQAMESGLDAVNQGVQQATAAGTAIQSLAENISANAQAATQIAMVGRQQREGVDQVLEAVQSIRDANTQNSQAADSLRQEAANLEILGRRLKDMVARYTVRKA